MDKIVAEKWTFLSEYNTPIANRRERSLYRETFIFLSPKAISYYLFYYFCRSVTI